MTDELHDEIVKIVSDHSKAVQKEFLTKSKWSEIIAIGTYATVSPRITGLQLLFFGKISKERIRVAQKLLESALDDKPSKTSGEESK